MKKEVALKQAWRNFFFHLAEGTRFELVVQNNPYGSLANCWFQPLTHPSGLKALKLRHSGRECKDTNNFGVNKYPNKKMQSGFAPGLHFWLNRNNDNLITNFSLVNCKVS